MYLVFFLLHCPQRLYNKTSMKHRMLYLLGMSSLWYNSCSGDIFFLLKNRINIVLTENTLCKRQFYPNQLFPVCSNNITIEQKFITFVQCERKLINALEICKDLLSSKIGSWASQRFLIDGKRLNLGMSHGMFASMQL